MDTKIETTNLKIIMPLFIGICFLIFPAYKINSLFAYAGIMSWMISYLLYRFWMIVVKGSEKNFSKIVKFLCLLIFILLINYIPQSMLLRAIQKDSIAPDIWGLDLYIFEILIRVVFDSQSYKDISAASKLFIGIFFTHSLIIGFLIANIFLKTEKFIEKTNTGSMLKGAGYQGIGLFSIPGIFGYWIILNATFSSGDFITVHTIFYHNVIFTYLLSVACFSAYIRSR